MFQVDRISYFLDIFKQNLWSDFNSDENTYNDMYKEHRFNTGNYYNFHYSVFVHNYLYTYISVLNVSCTTVMNRFSFFQLVFTRVFHRPDNAIQLPLQWCLAYVCRVSTGEQNGFNTHDVMISYSNCYKHAADSTTAIQPRRGI